MSSNNWKVYTLEDAYQDRDPVPYLLEGVFEIPSVNIVYGYPSTLKSMLLLDLAMCVATGKPWLANDNGVKTKATTKGGVLWVDFDNGVRRTHDRGKMVGRAHGAKPTDGFRYVTMPAGGLDMSNFESIKDLEDAVIFSETKLLVIDNLGTVIGSIDENSHGMALIMSAFRTLAERYQIAIVVIHHRRKGDSKGREGDALRGHSSVEAALDLALLVTRDANSNRVKIKSTKTRGQDVPEFAAYFSKELWIFEGVNTDGIEDKAKKAILSFLKLGEKNKAQIYRHCKDALSIGRERVDTALVGLLEDALVMESAGAKNSTVYSLSEAEQLILPDNMDIVGYNHEIEVTAGAS